MRRAPSFAACALILITWGALSFGAVYPWAYWPLAAAAALVGVYGLIQHRQVRVMPLSRGLFSALAATLVAIILQLIPLRHNTITAWSPNTTRVLENYDIGYASMVQTGHALSLRPEATLVTAALFAALVVFLLGAARALSLGGITPMASGLVALGLLLAVFGIVQKPLYAGKIYGLWAPYGPGNPFGPFINRNHYAGWMAMALSLSLGYLCGRVARSMLHAKPGFRNRVLWFLSEDASKTVLVAFAVLVMALAMVLTFSLAGIACLAVAVFVTGWTVVLHQRGSRRLLLGVYLALVVVVAVGWGSPDLVADRFAVADWIRVNGRLGAWKDAWNIARRFIIFGSGMNTYGITTIFFQTFDLNAHYAQAHNDYLQLLAEGGLLVTVPAAVATVLFVRDIRRRFVETDAEKMTYWIRIGAVTGLIAVALQEIVDFSLQMPGNALLFSVLAAIALHRPVADPAFVKREASRSRSLRVLGGISNPDQSGRSRPIQVGTSVGS